MTLAVLPERPSADVAEIQKEIEALAELQGVGCANRCAFLQRMAALLVQADEAIDVNQASSASANRIARAGVARFIS